MSKIILKRGILHAITSQIFGERGNALSIYYEARGERERKRRETDRPREKGVDETRS